MGTIKQTFLFKIPCLRYCVSITVCIYLCVKKIRQKFNLTAFGGGHTMESNEKQHAVRNQISPKERITASFEVTYNKIGYKKYKLRLWGQNHLITSSQLLSTDLPHFENIFDFVAKYINPNFKG